MVFLCLCLSAFAQAQNSHDENLKRLDQLLQDKNFAAAQTFLNNNLAELKAKKSYYLLTDYIYYASKIKNQLSNQDAGTKAIKQLAKYISTATDSLKILRQVNLNLAQYYEYVGDSKSAYDANLKALDITRKWKEATAEHLGLIESNLAVLSSRKGDVIESGKHAKRSLKLFESYPKTDTKNFYVVYNILGGSMWSQSKIDSAIYYFQKAERMLKTMEANPLNSYYRPAILQNNLAAIFEAQGNSAKSLKAMDNTIKYLYLFLKSDAADNKKEAAREFLFTAIDNYAGIYKEMGNFAKAKDLLLYSYQEKQKNFKSDNPELYKSKILLGQIYLSLKEYKRAETFLDAGIAHIGSIDSDANFWNADAHYSKALLYSEESKNQQAKKYYDLAGKLYKDVYEDSYDELYLDFTQKASRFYAQNNEREKALAMARNAYNYLKENQPSATSFEIQQALNLGEIYYELGDYQSALTNGLATIKLLDSNVRDGQNVRDSSQIIYYKPQTILLKTKSAYKIAKNQNDISFLKKIFVEVKEAITIVEKQKILVGDEKNISILIENNTELFEFAKDLALEIYSKTQNKSYLNDAISFHESILYNRIRSRLNSTSSIQFANVPQKVIQQEKKIKNALKNTLEKTDNIQEYLKINSQWNLYLKELKQNYPKYYKLRFASILTSVEDIAQKLPRNTSVIRYLYSEHDLYAVLISKYY